MNALLKILAIAPLVLAEQARPVSANLDAISTVAKAALRQLAQAQATSKGGAKQGSTVRLRIGPTGPDARLTMTPDHALDIVARVLADPRSASAARTFSHVSVIVENPDGAPSPGIVTCPTTTKASRRACSIYWVEPISGTRREPR
jgi:hypothetical protein